MRKGDRKKMGRKTFKRRKNVREHKGNMWMSRGGKWKWGNKHKDGERNVT